MIARRDHSVLVVDDNPANRYATSRALQAGGFHVVEATAGAEALELADYVSAVVLDVHLPDLLGFEVCRLLRGRPATSSLPVIHISAVYVREEDRATGEEAGADAYMLSPVDTDKLLASLDTLIAKRGIAPH